MVSVMSCRYSNNVSQTSMYNIEHKCRLLNVVMLAEIGHGNTSRIFPIILRKFASPGRRLVLFGRIMSFIK